MVHDAAHGKLIYLKDTGIYAFRIDGQFEMITDLQFEVF